MKKRIQFNANNFISNEETPVETRDGCPVEIYTTNRSGEYSVVGGIKNFTVKFWRSDGTSNEDYTYDELSTDLFFSPKKATRRMTWQELSWWLREKPEEEHREYKRKNCLSVNHYIEYQEHRANEECDPEIVIRSNGGEWEEPIKPINDEE